MGRDLGLLGRTSMMFRNSTLPFFLSSPPFLSSLQFGDTGFPNTPRNSDPARRRASVANPYRRPNRWDATDSLRGNCAHRILAPRWNYAPGMPRCDIGELPRGCKTSRGIPTLVLVENVMLEINFAPNSGMAPIGAAGNFVANFDVGKRDLQMRRCPRGPNVGFGCLRRAKLGKFRRSDDFKRAY